MAYIPITAEDEKAMLAVIGAKKLDDLFADVPPSVILKNGLDLPRGLTEPELKRFFNLIGKNNQPVSDRPCFLGAGVYYHEVPAAVKAVVTRPEFLTSYTPYQPEIAQGTLQTLFDFQTYMVELTGLEVSNASLYDGASSAAEAALLALRIKKAESFVYVSRGVHPEYRQTIQTYLNPLGHKIREIPLKGTETDLEQLKTDLWPNSVVMVQYPNFLGTVEDLAAIAKVCKEKNAYLVAVVAEAMNLGLLPSPASLGADICAGSAQSFGNILSFGGPHAGFLTAKFDDIRQMPGRIVGETVDRNGKPSCVLTFQAREQHIRRERAASNVCTTQSLMANFASAWLYFKGGAGAQQAARDGAATAHAIATEIAKLPGFKIETARYCNEFVIRPPSAGFADFLAEWGIVAPFDLSKDYPEFKDCVLAACTEMTSLEDMESFISACEDFSKHAGNASAGAGHKVHQKPSQLPAWIQARPTPKIEAHHEVEVIRYFTELARKNFCIDNGFYPLGSCTMKYNPKVHEEIAFQDAWANLHPSQREDEVQGALQVIYELEHWLHEVTGCHALTLQPAAGAHGELTALLMAKRYFADRGEHQRMNVIVPDSAHGTNPASATMAGWKTVSIPTDSRGNMDLEALKGKLGKDTAVLMLTNPSTLGLFEEHILEVAKLVHDAGGLLYYDGANMNAILGICRPADMGFDLVHLNLHKSFSTPHGGGGPGSGPVGCTKALEPYLPEPRVAKEGNRYYLRSGSPQSIGRMKGNVGNFGVLLRALAYCKRNGKEGLERVGRIATLNANYLLARLKNHYPVAYDRICKHEFVLTAEPLKKKYGISALDIAKRIIDFNYHPPTIYFPLVVPESIMVEPTETETKKTLDEFVDAMLKIRTEMETNPDVFKNAPYSTPVSRLDEVKAVKEPKLVKK
ncbi:MAG TPA: aminomethyl-transferring glycine dehydrogenase subunit GcvPB [bacterium]|nr:aminomethyl-transferring glycine dehydrogenase subunit GcvPB [bacterium]